MLLRSSRPSSSLFSLLRCSQRLSVLPSTSPLYSTSVGSVAYSSASLEEDRVLGGAGAQEVWRGTSTTRTRKILELQLNLISHECSRLDRKKKKPIAKTIKILRHAALANDAHMVDKIARFVMDDDSWVNKKTYNTIFSCYSRTGQSERASRVFEAMKARKRLSPDVTTYNILMRNQGPNWRKALSVLDSMIDAGVRPDHHTYSALINACCAGGNPAEALQVLRQLRTNRIPATVHHYTALIGSSISTGNSTEAKKLMLEMMQDGIRPNEVTYSILITCAIRAGNTDHAMTMLEEMESSGLRSTTVAYTQFITAFLGVYDKDGAQQMYHRMKQLDLPLDSQAVNEIFKIVGSTSEAVDVLRKSHDEHNLIINDHVFNTLRMTGAPTMTPEDHHYLLSYMRNNGFYNQGVLWHEYMQANKVDPSQDAMDLLNEIYSKLERPLPGAAASDSSQGSASTAE